MEYTQVSYNQLLAFQDRCWLPARLPFCLANVGHGVEDVPDTVSLDGKRNDTAPINIIWNGIEKGSAVEVSFFVWFGFDIGVLHYL